MSVASPKVVHALAEERLEDTQGTPQHEAPILAAPLGEKTNSNIEFESEPGQTVPEVTTPVDGRPPTPRTSSEEVQNLVTPESEKIARSMESKTTSPDAPTLLTHTSEATQIPTALLKEYARNAGESDEREHNFYAKQLDSQLIFVRAPRPLVNAISCFHTGWYFLRGHRAIDPADVPHAAGSKPERFRDCYKRRFFRILGHSLEPLHGDHVLARQDVARRLPGSLVLSGL